MTPCTLKLIDMPGFNPGRGLVSEVAKYAPYNLIRYCAHLVGETVFVSAILSRGNGHGPS
jgi:hypothetical protein